MYRKYRAMQQVWTIDFEVWGGKKERIAAIGLQGCIVNLFDASKRFTFEINYSMSLEDMQATFARAWPDKHQHHADIQ